MEKLKNIIAHIIVGLFFGGIITLYINMLEIMIPVTIIILSCMIIAWAIHKVFLGG